VPFGTLPVFSQDRDDVRALIGKAGMAVIGSQTIRLVDKKGAGVVGPFIAGLL
jgi:tryptophan synthase alpha chain